MTSGFAPPSIIAAELDMRGYSGIVGVFRQKYGFLPDRACPRFKGVADRIRTGDHLDHNQGLYQLSYSHRANPIYRSPRELAPAPGVRQPKNRAALLRPSIQGAATEELGQPRASGRPQPNVRRRCFRLGH
jgi:hypothetical protein